MAGLMTLKNLSELAAQEGYPGMPLDEWAVARDSFANTAMPTTTKKWADDPVSPTRAPGAGPGLNMDLT